MSAIPKSATPKIPLSPTLNYNNDFLTTGEQKFDAAEFNKKFEAQKEVQKKASQQRDDAELAKLNAPEPSKSLYELSLSEIFVGIKDTIFGIMDDILNGNLTDILVRNDRLFYLGILLMIFTIILYLYDSLDESAATTSKSNPNEIIIRLQKE